MTAFLKIDDCKTCHRSLPWEWVAAVLLNGKALSGTGVWHSQLVGGLCSACLAVLEAQREKERRSLALRGQLIRLLGGERPYREFTFERYQVTPENQLAYERSKHFDPSAENLYLWGPCGVGKTHLGWAIARICFESGTSVIIQRAAQLSRKVRMREPDQEQTAIDEFVKAQVLILDDLGQGADTGFSRQVLQEILDGRHFRDGGGLVVTSSYSLDALATKLTTDSISSRLAGLCQVISLEDVDHRLQKGRHA